jgi:hypothetical protein
MPLTHPTGYEPPLQTRVDRRRVLLAGGCGALGETMRQLAAIAGRET